MPCQHEIHIHTHKTQVNNATARVQTKKAPATLPQGKHFDFIPPGTWSALCLCVLFFHHQFVNVIFPDLLLYVFVRIEMSVLFSRIHVVDFAFKFYIPTIYILYTIYIFRNAEPPCHRHHPSENAP